MSALVQLHQIGSGRLDAVGGKAMGLAALIKAGFAVPPGFCVTTAAYRAGEIDRAELATALSGLGEEPVAVRSSATAEDLPYASFAGQQDTLLNVRGVDAVTEAIYRCWASLHNERAIAYRAAHGIVETPAMGVVVQRMIDPVTAGVLFTADPLTQTRGRAVIEAVVGLGTGVVDGTAETDHYTVDRASHVTGPAHGCLGDAQVLALAETGRRVEDALGAPQDIEWAHDHEGVLWLLQSRPITSLFPLVDNPDDGKRVFMEIGQMAGLHGPVTPMGQSVIKLAMRDWLAALGVETGRNGTAQFWTYIGDRMFIELTGLLRNRWIRTRLNRSLDVYGPRVKRPVRYLLDDPRFAPSNQGGLPLRALTRILLRAAPPLAGDMIAALIRPQHARDRAFAALESIRNAPTPPTDVTLDERLRNASRLQQPVAELVDAQLGALYGAFAARSIAAVLLRGLADDGEIDQTQRGMPHNVTISMDLDLWAVAEQARPYADLLMRTPPEELARRYTAGELPDIGLAAFLERYGHRGAAEIDIGVPRWREDPTGVFAALAGYFRVTTPDAAPDRRFARAASEAEQALAALSARALRARPVRGRAAAFLLRRNRELGGLRELPKFSWLYPLDRVRRELLRTGEQLADRGLLERPDDIMMLFWEEAEQAAHGADLRELVAIRRATYDREMLRRQIPAVLLSDGTDVEATLPAVGGEGVLSGLAAAPGLATGRARIVHDPRTAQLEPGEILVAPTTDPGWTPLFMTAAGLVTETGSPMAHGATVAREYGIPAVLCLRRATIRLNTGDLIEIDGTAGTVRILDGSGAGAGAGAELR